MAPSKKNAVTKNIKTLNIKSRNKSNCSISKPKQSTKKSQSQKNIQKQNMKKIAVNVPKKIQKGESLLKKKNLAKAMKPKKPLAKKKVVPKQVKKNKVPTIDSQFSIETFFSDKMGINYEKNKEMTISDSGKSSLLDLIRFNTNLAHSFYNVTEHDSLEATAFALQPKVDINGLETPAVKIAVKEVALYKDLLLLGDLPTITQEKRIYEWIGAAPNLSKPAMVAIIISFITLAMKMTGRRPKRYSSKVPGGKLVKTKADVTSYLAIMQTIVNAMDKSKMKKINNFKKMEDDLTHIIEEA